MKHNKLFLVNEDKDICVLHNCIHLVLYKRFMNTTNYVIKSSIQLSNYPNNKMSTYSKPILNNCTLITRIINIKRYHFIGSVRTSK